MEISLTLTIDFALQTGFRNELYVQLFQSSWITINIYNILKSSRVGDIYNLCSESRKDQIKIDNKFTELT